MMDFRLRSLKFRGRKNVGSVLTRLREPILKKGSTRRNSEFFPIPSPFKSLPPTGYLFALLDSTASVAPKHISNSLIVTREIKRI